MLAVWEDCKLCFWKIWRADGYFQTQSLHPPWNPITAEDGIHPIHGQLHKCMDVDTCHVAKYAIYSYLKILVGKFKISLWFTPLRDLKCSEKIWNRETLVSESSYPKIKKVRETKAERIKKLKDAAKTTQNTFNTSWVDLRISSPLIYLWFLFYCQY